MPLVITRKLGERFRIRAGEHVAWVQVVRIDRNQVRIGIEGDIEVIEVLREELLEDEEFEIESAS